MCVRVSTTNAYREHVRVTADEVVRFQPLQQAGKLRAFEDGALKRGITWPITFVQAVGVVSVCQCIRHYV